jgi:ankyrin repeat protein
MSRVSGVDEFGRTALHHAAADGDLARVLELLAGGANPNVSDSRSWAPLHFAAQARSASVARALLDAGADIDSVDDNGNTPLWRAVFNSRGDGELIRLLREYGADPYRMNSHGQSPVSLAHTISNNEVAQYFSDLET